MEEKAFRELWQTKNERKSLALPTNRLVFYQLCLIVSKSAYSEEVKLMASESVVRLLKAAEGDEALRSKLESAENAESLVKTGAEHGYEFTVDEVKDVLVQMEQQASEELKHDELDKIAGGFGKEVSGTTAGRFGLSILTGWRGYVK
jgi:predicted ribosomally synthesized peptide with nif11-like leader